MTRRIAIILALAAAGAAAATTALRTPRTQPPIPATIANSVTSFPSGHPEWAVLRESRKDSTPLRMGHALHMKPGLKGAPPGGLRCVSCHVPDDAGAYMKPITFDAHCRSCHEESLGRISVAEGVIDSERSPHGSTDELRQAVTRKLGEWVKAQPERFVIAPATDPAAAPDAAQAQEEKSAEPPTSRRRRGSADTSKPDAKVPSFESIEARNAWLDTQTARAIAALATEHRCGYCHVGAASPGAETAAQLNIRPPEIPDRWLPRSRFSHAAHQMIRCDECHAAATSESTADIIIPSITTCAECHAPAHTGAGAPHDCVLCHSYHQPAPATEGIRMSKDLRK